MSQAGSRPAVGGFEDGAWAYAAAAQRKTISRTVSIYHAGRVGQTIALRGLSCLAADCDDRRQKPIVCPTGFADYSSPPGGGGGGGAGGALVPVPVPVFPVPVPVAVPVPVGLPWSPLLPGLIGPPLVPVLPGPLGRW